MGEQLSRYQIAGSLGGLALKGIPKSEAHRAKIRAARTAVIHLNDQDLVAWEVT